MGFHGALPASRLAGAYLEDAAQHHLLDATREVDYRTEQGFGLGLPK